MKFYAYKHKDSNEMLAVMESGLIGLVYPGVDSNYYQYIIFMSEYRRASCIKINTYLEMCSKTVDPEFAWAIEEIELTIFECP